MSMLKDTPNLLTTGQAAKFCSVTPDTILKWIKKGRINGVRTAGGHYRIERRELEPHIVSPDPAEDSSRPGSRSKSQPVHCWEYLNHTKSVREGCRQCVVYRLRAARCYEAERLEPDAGHARQFCQQSCEECAYYRRVKGLATKVLVVTADNDLVNRLTSEDDKSVALCFARNAYEASAIIGDFRPALVAIDANRIPAGDTELLETLATDPRVPGLRIVLIVPTGMRNRRRSLEKSDMVLSVLEKPFGIETITAVLNRFPVDPVTVGKSDPQAVSSEASEEATPAGDDTKGIAMTETETTLPESSFDNDGFLTVMSKWNRSMAQELAEKNDIGPLTDEHWEVIEYVKQYYETYGSGPPVVKIGKTVGMSAEKICDLFPCGVVKGAYRLAGLPRPPGCV